MPARKHTSNQPKLLPSRSTTTSKKRRQSGGQTDKAISTAALASEEVSGEHHAALSYRDKGNQVPRLTEARAKELTAEILKDHDDDEIVMDLIELVTGIAYDPVDIDRDSLASASTRKAVMFAPAFSNAIASFATRAAMRGSPAPAPASEVVSERTPVFPIFAEGGAQLGWDAAREAGRLCADYSVTLNSATQAFEEEMIAETLRFYPNGGHDAALHLGMSVGQLGKLLRRIQRRQKSKAKVGATGRKAKGTVTR